MSRIGVPVGLVLILGLVAWTAWDVWTAARLWPWSPTKVPNDVPHLEKRCAEIRDQLPAQGAVGYRDHVRKGRGRDLSPRRHAIVQYALVPLIVEWRTDRTPAVELTGPTSAPLVRVTQAGDP